MEKKEIVVVTASYAYQQKKVMPGTAARYVVQPETTTTSA